MKRVIQCSVMLMLILIFTGLCLASDIDGKWNGKIRGPEGDMELTFNFKVAGDTLSGTVSSPMGDMPIANGRVQGGKFSFDVNVGDMTIRHWCRMSADSISMKYTGMQGDTMQIFLKRPVQVKQ
jgi:hypothetical protein